MPEAVCVELQTVCFGCLSDQIGESVNFHRSAVQICEDQISAEVLQDLTGKGDEVFRHRYDPLAVSDLLDRYETPQAF